MIHSIKDIATFVRPAKLRYIICYHDPAFGKCSTFHMQRMECASVPMSLSVSHLLPGCDLPAK